MFFIGWSTITLLRLFPALEMSVSISVRVISVSDLRAQE